MIIARIETHPYVKIYEVIIYIYIFFSIYWLPLEDDREPIQYPKN